MSSVIPQDYYINCTVVYPKGSRALEPTGFRPCVALKIGGSPAFRNSEKISFSACVSRCFSWKNKDP